MESTGRENIPRPSSISRTTENIRSTNSTSVYGADFLLEKIRGCRKTLAMATTENSRRSDSSFSGERVVKVTDGENKEEMDEGRLMNARGFRKTVDVGDGSNEGSS